MADFKPIYTGSKVVGYKGKLAGKSVGRSPEEIEEDEFQAHVTKTKPELSGLGGGAARKKFLESDVGKKFRADWSAGRKKPTVTGTPVVKTGM